MTEKSWTEDPYEIVRQFMNLTAAAFWTDQLEACRKTLKQPGVQAKVSAYWYWLLRDIDNELARRSGVLCTFDFRSN